jgi:hypothetical protein
MATSNKNLNQPAVGSTSPNWGDLLNNNTGYLDSALGGTSVIAVSSGSTSRSLTESEYQPMTLIFGGSLPATDIVYSLPSGVGGNWYVWNTATNPSSKTLSLSTSTVGVITATVLIPSGGPWLVSCNTTTGISITQSAIVDGSITTAKIADSAVATAKIADSAVATAKIADSAVATAKIADSAVSAAKIASNAVTTAKIADSNVTTAKVADSNITTAKIANAAITPAKMNGAQTGNAPVYGVRAWGVAATSGGVVTLGANGNIASIVRVSTGLYTVTMTTAMPQASYAVAITPSVSGAYGGFATIASITSATQFQFLCQYVETGGNVGSQRYDPPYLSFMVLC